MVPKTLVQINSDTSNTGNILVYLSFFFNKLLQTTKLNAVMVLNLDEWISKTKHQQMHIQPQNNRWQCGQASQEYLYSVVRHSVCTARFKGEDCNAHKSVSQSECVCLWVIKYRASVVFSIFIQHDREDKQFGRRGHGLDSFSQSKFQCRVWRMEKGGPLI